jgi:hypothetical protein
LSVTGNGNAFVLDQGEVSAISPAALAQRALENNRTSRYPNSRA